MKTKMFGFLVVGAMFLALTGFSSQSDAGVNVGIGINIPTVGIGVNIPAYTFAAPPPVVVVPGTNVYVAPEANIDIVFYRGYWYRPYEGRWYRASDYNGPWAHLAPSRVPHVLVDLPPDYRNIPPGHTRIPYGQLKKNWGRWESERYWDRHRDWHEEKEGWREAGHGKHERGKHHHDD